MNLRPKQRLELAYIGKDAKPKLERRIPLEGPTRSHYVNRRVTENDIFDNRLIFWDNLLVLKAHEFASEVKCVFVDPVATADYIKSYREHWDNEEHRRAYE